MGRSPASETKLSGIPSDGSFSWAMFWTYFSSEFCTDEMRAWTLKNVNLIDCITGCLPQVQIEILEAAPKVILNHPAIKEKLTSQARKTLLGETVTSPTDEPAWCVAAKNILRKRGHLRE